MVSIFLVGMVVSCHQKDDVPAMLMAGEFVFTKDAVKGLGNGDSEKGIQKAYSMMNQLENKANNYG